MFQKLLRLLGQLYGLLWALILTGLLGVAALVTWHFYQEEHLQSQLRTEGQPVTVRIERTDKTSRELWDALGNFTYVGFTYHNQPYETRVVSDTVWLSTGDRVALLYHPRLDVFRQPPRMQSSPSRVVSRLINWTVAASFTAEAKALGLFALVAMALFFVISGLLATITGLTFVRTIARAVLIVGLVAAALFFSYDTMQYFRYATQLQRNGRPMEVAVVDTDRHTHGRKTSWYTYDATFRFNGQERVVPIEEADYKRLNPKNAQLTVRYDATLNDFIAAGYSPSWLEAVTPGFFWLLLFLTLRPIRTRPAAPQRNQAE
ncbi:MAG TPA: hypothetical protein VF690_10480 [Hymenobacter sp.]|jgi:hypothetical protein